MINKENYITLSLELHLFWARIMKEHAIFLEAGFTPKNIKLSKEADHYKTCFEKLLCDVVKLSNSRIRECVISSGEIITKYTPEAEKKTKYYTGIDIDSNITVKEKDFECKTSDKYNKKLINNIRNININTIKLLDKLIKFKMKILENVQCCELFTVNYPSLLEHIIEEGKLYLKCVKALESDTDMQNIRDIELFWNHIMMEHSLFIRGSLDPSEDELIKTSDNFAKEFKDLTKESDYDDLNRDSLNETIKLRDFKTAGVQGILDCKIKSIILPLLADHVLREANHYIRLLKENN